jgi:signal transduction histidine kinase
VLPALTKEVELDYTSPSFALPQRLQLHYKLDGTDNGWVDSGNRRQAFFTNLGPGLYRFHVRASAGELPSTAESVTTFRIAARFYQTPEFMALCVTVGLVGAIVLIRLRIVALERNLRASLQVRLEERERIARDLHDTLFQSVQGLFLTIDNSTNTLPEGHPTRSALKVALERSDEVMAESRERVLELRAEGLGRQSIGQALGQVGNELSKLYPTAFRAVELGTPQDLHPVVFEEVFHVGREALFNAYRHADASQIEVEILFTRDTFSVRINDNGRGIDASVLSEGGRPGHFGLRGMLERARKIGARLTIRSRPHAGTELELSMSRAVASGSRRAGWHWLRLDRGALWR